jgi:acyl carrier protein
VRAQKDGTIEFVGRRDRQVKVRGFRIELAEVEAALGRIEGVQESVVRTAPDGARLVAYVVTDGVLSGEQIKSALQAQLPAYMVPGQVVLLEQLPLTNHGKVNEGALRALAESMERDGRTEEGGAPLSEAEQTVAEVWGAVLGLQGLGRQANFFDLGGHSLMATQIITRLRSAFGFEIPVEDLFDHATVADFAAHVQAMRQMTAHLQTPVNLMQPREEGEL